VGLRDWLGLKRKKPPSRIGGNCSFCGQAPTESKKLVAGPGLFICDSCVENLSDMARGQEPRLATLPDACSFCSKSRRKVRVIVGDEKASICDQCLGLCRDILAERLRSG